MVHILFMKIISFSFSVEMLNTFIISMKAALTGPRWPVQCHRDVLKWRWSAAHILDFSPKISESPYLNAICGSLTQGFEGTLVWEDLDSGGLGTIDSSSVELSDGGGVIKISSVCTRAVQRLVVKFQNLKIMFSWIVDRRGYTASSERSRVSWFGWRHHIHHLWLVLLDNWSWAFHRTNAIRVVLPLPV